MGRFPAFRPIGWRILADAEFVLSGERCAPGPC
jgi:hypothetical protein